MKARLSWRRLLGMAAIGLAAWTVLGRLGEAAGARARAEMLAVGADMLRMPESPGGQPETILMNGAELRVVRGRAPRSLDDVLSAAQASCDGTATRGGDERRGFVACTDGDELSLPLDFVYAERRAELVHFIDLHSPQRLDVRALFPRDADAPGTDPVALPRPSSSRRALTMRVGDQPYEAAVYLDGARTLDQLVAHYQATLPGAGWSSVAPWKVDEGPGPRQASVVIERAGVLALLQVAQDRADAVTTTFLTMETNREQ